MMSKTKVVKFPTDILQSLKRDYPDPYYTNPARIRLMFNDYVEMKEIKGKLQKAGEIVYGKNAWNKRYKK
jgi:hypothetical protein